ncbi:hypothetical protein II906_08960, partial [bacterium]|nr:hypothetical protein [bacterium]
NPPKGEFIGTPIENPCRISILSEINKKKSSLIGVSLLEKPTEESKNKHYVSYYSSTYLYDKKNHSVISRVFTETGPCISMPGSPNYEEIKLQPNQSFARFMADKIMDSKIPPVKYEYASLLEEE